MSDKLCAILIISLLAFSIYVTWMNNVLQITYDDLVNSWEECKQASIFDQTLPMPEGLDEHYERIRKYESNKFTSEGAVGRLVFYVTQVLHDLGNYSYGQRYEEYNDTVGVNCKNLTLSFTVDFLDYINKSMTCIGWSNSNMSEMQVIYDWTDYFVTYVNETNDFERFPIETLTCRYGDCEDQAMALAFLLESCGYQTALCYLHDKNWTDNSSEGLSHVFCVARKNDFKYNGTLIQLHEYPECGNSWIVLDPAFNHPFGVDAGWMEYYRMDNGTVRIPQAACDSLLVDYDAILERTREIGIDLNY